PKGPQPPHHHPVRGLPRLRSHEQLLPPRRPLQPPLPSQGTLGRAPYAAIAGSSREPIARDPRLKTRMDDHQEKCFDTEHRLLVKTPEPKQPILQQRPPKRQQEEDETANIRRRGGRGRRNIDAAEQSDRPQSVAQSVASAFEPTTTMTASAQVVAPPKEQRLRKPKRLRSAGADITTHPEPSEVPVVAASSQRTKAKPATSDQAPTASEGTAAEILGKLIQAGIAQRCPMYPITTPGEVDRMAEDLQRHIKEALDNAHLSNRQPNRPNLPSTLLRMIEEKRRTRRLYQTTSIRPPDSRDRRLPRDLLEEAE
ncbi:hypothetical protein ACJJTC_008696, partial [Scirpophaga incertulas]